MFCFLSPIQRGLSTTYPAPILTIFETKDTNRCAHAYTVDKFQIFCAEVLQVPKQLRMGTFEVGVCDKAAAQS